MTISVKQTGFAAGISDLMFDFKETEFLV